MNKENSSQLHSHNYSTFIQFHLTINSAIDNMYKVVMMLSKFEQNGSEDGSLFDGSRERRKCSHIFICSYLQLGQIFLFHILQYQSEQLFEKINTSIRFSKGQLDLFSRSVPPLPDTGIISYLKMIFWLFLQFLCKNMFFSRNCVHIGLLY